MYEAWKRWGLPPRGGGLLDQPANLLERMGIVVDIVNGMRAYNAHWTETGWLIAHPEITQIMSLVWKVREQYGSI